MHKDLRCHSVFVFGQLCQSSTEPCASKPCKFALPLLIAPKSPKSLLDSDFGQIRGTVHPKMNTVASAENMRL